MSGLPFPTSTNKWIGIPEAKHPLIQDLIKLWEESPGYILPQNSFIKDRAKLEALIDSFIEMQKQKAQMPAKPAGNSVLAKAASSEAAKAGEDSNWEKSLVSALAMSRVNPSVGTESKLPAIPAFPDLTKIPGAADKLAELKVLDNLPSVDKVEIKPFNIHILVLYGLSLASFILSLLALKWRI